VSFIGSLPLHLLTRQGTTAMLLDFVIRPKVVLISLGNRPLGTVGRDELINWLLDRSAPLWAEDVVFATEGDRVTIAVNYRRPCLVPDVFVRQLIEVL
jgi:hypothetical protein